MTMLIKDLLEEGNCRPAAITREDVPLLEAAGRLQELNATALVVMSQNRINGVLSDRDLVNAIAEKGTGIAIMTVGDAMNRTLVTCTLNDDVTDTLNRMSTAGVHHVPVLKDGVPITVLTSREFESACRILKTQADTDEVTGLFNRRNFLRLLDAELNRYRRHRTPLALAMIDIDHFKKVNDHLGHADGDKLLRSVAQTLASEVRSFDIVARYGGDEFAILFPQTRLSEAVDACRRLSTACSQLPLPRIDGVFCLSLSCGVTVANPGDTEVKSIVNRADQSLYQAKESGRGRVVAARTAAPDRLLSA